MSNTMLWNNHINRFQLRYFFLDRCGSKRPQAFLSIRVGNRWAYSTCVLGQKACFAEGRW
jgi:hypothetical protein